MVVRLHELATLALSELIYIGENQAAPGIPERDLVKALRLMNKADGLHEQQRLIANQFRALASSGTRTPDARIRGTLVRLGLWDSSKVPEFKPLCAEAVFLLQNLPRGGQGQRAPERKWTCAVNDILKPLGIGATNGAALATNIHRAPPTKKK